MLALARDRFAPDLGLDAFILETIADEALRAERTAALHSSAQRPQFADFDVLMG
jgi:hypothetical protein